MIMKNSLGIAAILVMSAGAFAQGKITEGTPVYYPLNEHNTPTAYIGIPFKVNEYKNRDGDYKVELHICDTQNVCIGKLFIGSAAQFTSTSPEDAGKDIEVTTFFRPLHSADWLKMRSTHARIEPPPLKVVMLDKIIPASEQQVSVYYGIEGYSTPPKSDVLEVSSGGFFEDQAIKVTKPLSEEVQPLHEEMAPLSADYVLKPTERYKNLAKEIIIPVTFSDPKTGKHFTKTVTLLPSGKASR